MLPGGEPLEIELADATDNVFEPLLSQKITCNLVCQAYWQVSGFYVTEPKQLQILIEHDPAGGTSFVPLRRGWVSPAELKEDYGPKPYVVSVSATCGLPLLKDIPFLDKDGKRLKGQVSHSEVIRTALYHIGLGYNLVSGVNLYESSELSPAYVVNGTANPATDPLYQVMEDADAFVDDNGVTLSCWDALMKVVPGDRRLKQSGDAWTLYRVPDMIGGWDAGSAKTATSIHVRKHTATNPAAAPSSHESIELGVTVNGTDNKLRVAEDPSETWLQSIVEGVRIEQDFGRWKNTLPDFSQVDGTGLPVGWTVNNIVTTSRFRTGAGTEDSPYALTILGGADEKINNTAQYVSIRKDYDVSSREYTKFLHRTLKGRFRLANTRAAQVWAVALRDDEPYLYTEGGWIAYSKAKQAQSVKTRIYNTMPVNGVQVAKPGWADINIDLGIIDRVKALIIFLGMAEALDVKASGVPEKIEYADIRLEVEQEGLNLDGMSQTIVRPGKSVKDTTLKISLGEVPTAASPYDRLGTTYIHSTYPPYSNVTTLWHHPTWIFLGNGTIANGGKPKTWLGWLTETYAKQLMYPAPVFEGDLIGDLPHGPDSVLRFADAPELGPGIITRWKWSVRSNTHSITAQRLMSDVDVSTLPKPEKKWDTPDGEVVMPEDADGTALVPTESNKKSARQAQADAISIANPAVPTGNIKFPGYTPLTGSTVGIPTGTIKINGKAAGLVMPHYFKQLDLSQLIKR